MLLKELKGYHEKGCFVYTDDELLKSPAKVDKERSDPGGDAWDREEGDWLSKVVDGNRWRRADCLHLIAPGLGVIPIIPSGAYIRTALVLCGSERNDAPHPLLPSILCALGLCLSCVYVVVLVAYICILKAFQLGRHIFPRWPNRYVKKEEKEESLRPFQLMVLLVNNTVGNTADEERTVVEPTEISFRHHNERLHIFFLVYKKKRQESSWLSTNWSILNDITFQILFWLFGSTTSPPILKLQRIYLQKKKHHTHT